MLKKLVIAFFALSVLLISVVSAIEIGDEFYLYGRDNEKLAKALLMSESQVDDYYEANDLTLLATNADNTKQIREVTTVTEFSKTIKNLAVLEDDKILKLTKELSGFDNVKGTVVEKDAYKYLKIEVKSTDEGGEYYLTQYITVKGGKHIVLSFYTSDGKDRGYIEKIFNSQFEDVVALKTTVTVLMIICIIVTVVMAVLVVLDLVKIKKSKAVSE